jgi:zinc protease
MNLREEKGWAYGARTVPQNARGPRPLLVYAPVQTDRTGDSIAELVRELRTIATTRPITADEMSRVIAGSTRELPGRFETAGAVLGSMASSARYGRPLDYAASLAERYEALTLADLQNAAREVVHPESLIWIVVGDVSQIRTQVERLNIAPVEIWNDDGQPAN